MLDYYDSLIAKCTTLNQVNRAHITLSNIITPDEAMLLWRSLFKDGIHAGPPPSPSSAFSAEDLRQAAREWINKQRLDLAASGKDGIEPFLRRILHENATLFTDGRPRDAKTLVVALTGANYRMMMPVPTFLQNLDASTTDLVIIRDGMRHGYRKGVAGLADSVEDLADRLPDWLEMSSYRRVCGLGISAGGLPTLLVGLRLGIPNLLLVGPSGPSDARWARPGHPAIADTVRAAGADGTRRRIVIAYGAQCEEDREGAREIADLIDVRIVEVSDPFEPVGHPALHPLAARGKLAAFLHEHLGFDD